MTALESIIEEYLTDCRARGLSPATIRGSYQFTLQEVFLPWCEAQGVRTLEDVTNRLLSRWQADLLDKPGRGGKPLSRFSIASYIGAVNTFLRWARTEGEMKHEARARPPRLSKRELQVLSRAEIQAIEDAAPTERDKLIIRILADTGLRAGELLGLRVGDVVTINREQFLRIRHRTAGGGLKGQKERNVPIPRLYRRLERLTRGRDHQEWIFLTHRRMPSTGMREPLTISGLEKMLRNTAERAGLKQRVYPHLLRHSYATWALTRGMNPIQLADILGHSSLTMLARNYSHLTAQDAYAAAARLLAEE